MHGHVRLTPLLFFAFLAVLSVSLLAPAIAGPTSFTSDNFNSRNLQRPLWSFTDPLGDCSVRMGGYKSDSARVMITVPAGVIHDTWTQGYESPRILQSATNTDFTIDVKYFSGMTGQSFVNYQTEGILIEQDAQNVMRFDFTTGHLVDSVKAFAAVFQNGFASPQAKIDNKHFAGYGVSPLWMRVRRTGNVWKMYYSLNGTTFTLADSFVYAINVTKVGLACGNAGPNPAEFTSAADYFFNADAPITPEDSNPLPDNLSPLVYNLSFYSKPNCFIVRWKTDEPSDGTVEWGATTSYLGAPVSHSGLFTAHRLIVSGLDPNNTYHFRVKSTDDSAHQAVSSDYSFPSGDYIADYNLLSDDFNGASIDGAIWTTVNPRSDATFGITNKKLSIAIPGGVAHDLWTDGYNVPRVMQAVKNNADAYEFTVKFTSAFTGTSTSQFAQGILAEQDANNIIRANFNYDNTGLRVFVAGFYDGLATPEVLGQDQVLGATGPVWLRLVQGGGRFWVYYSINGTSWTLIPSFARPMNIKKVGVFGGNAGSSPQAMTVLAEYVGTTIPAKPVLLLPLNNAVNVPTPVIVQWDTTAGAATYRLQASTDAGFGSLAFNDSTITVTSKLVPSLLYSTKYYWRVLGKNTNVNTYGAMSDVFNFTTAIAPPAVPTQLFPADNVIDVDPGLTLRWTKPATTVTFRLQVGTDSTFATGVAFNDSTLTDSTKAMTGLLNLTKYYWRVNAKNAGGSSGWSAVRAFTTISAVPLAPVLRIPLDGAVNQVTNLTLRWNRSNFAATYRLQVGTDSTFASGLAYNDSTLTDTLKAMSGLVNSTKYFWRVNAKNLAGTSAYSTVWSFTTIISNPNAPSLVAPVDGATNQDLSVKFVWRRPPTATSFRLQAGSDSTFATGIVVNDSTITDTTKTAGGFVFGVKYFWRVSAKNIGGASAYSSVFSFRTWDSDPAIPKQLNPPNGTTGLDIAVLLFWTRPAGATSFHLQVGTDSTFAGGFVVNDPALADSFKNLIGLNYLTKYYWRVNADAVGGTSPYSPRWSFTTGIPAASQPSLVYPGPGQSVYPATLKLIWHKSIPAVDRYWVDVAQDPAFNFALPPDSMVTDTTKSISGLADKQLYYWRVRAHNGGGWGPYSEVRSFTRDITGVNEMAAIPKEFQLNQNYPNPFNPATQIEFGVPKEARVTLEVYNLLGQKVATLLDEIRAAGYHTVKFDASSLPSGLYLYRMTAGETSFIRKMMLVK